MPAAQINVERLGNTRWIGQVVGPRGGREIGRNPVIETVDELLDAIRAALGEVGDPSPPMAPLIPPPLAVPAPGRMPRHTRRDLEPDPPPLVVVASARPAPLPIGKVTAARMREAADEAADAAMPGLAARRADLARRRV